MGLDWCILVTELRMAATRMTAQATTTKMADRSRHMAVMSEVLVEKNTSPCRYPLELETGRPTMNRALEYNPFRVVMPS